MVERVVACAAVRFHLHLPDDLAAKLDERAARENRSRSNLVSTLLASALGGRDDHGSLGSVAVRPPNADLTEVKPDPRPAAGRKR